MRFLTKEEWKILNTCSSTATMLKAALCLMLEADGGMVEPRNGQIAGHGRDRIRKVVRTDEFGVKSEVTLHESAILLVGCGMFNWWAKVTWLVGAKPQENRVMMYERAFPRIQ